MLVEVSDCGKGVGIGLNSLNLITELAPGGAAARGGQLQLGDCVLGVDGETLEGRPLRQVLRPADSHTFEVVRGAAVHGTPSTSRSGRGGMDRCWRKSAAQARLSNIALAYELRSLHAVKVEQFDPQNSAHEQLLKSIWSAMRPEEPYVRTGAGWKEIGFQGEDPASDVRAGGLLAVQCLAHFATTQTVGMRLMLREIRAAEVRTHGPIARTRSARSACSACAYAPSPDTPLRICTTKTRSGTRCGTILCRPWVW